MELEEGDRESAISSLTDSFEEEEEQDEQTQDSTRPRLKYAVSVILTHSYISLSLFRSPFYGPDSASMLSLPHGHRTLVSILLYTLCDSCVTHSFSLV